MVMATSNKSCATILKNNQERRLGIKCSKTNAKTLYYNANGDT